MIISMRRSITGLAMLGLAGCGGSSSPDPVALILNNLPNFTSSLSVSVAENTTGIVYTATASDTDGDSLTLSLTSGGDSAVFTFDPATGELAFANAPDFEAPTDADGDNVYEIPFRVTDGQGGSADITVELTVTDVNETIAVRRVGAGFSQPLYLEGLPDGSGRVVVLERTGRIRLLDPDTGAIDPVDFLDVSASISITGERGLLGLAFAPDFATSGIFYINMSNIAGDTEIRRYATFTGSLDQGDPATADVILTYAQPATNHNAGWLGFDAGGLLVIPTGDGGGSGDPNDLAQNTQSLLGKVLRIDVSGDDFPADDLRDYVIPPGNTFDGDAAAGLPEIFAVGLRNPFRASFDPASGDLIMADVGQDAIEEIDRLPMDDATRNFGWNIREGTAFFSGADSTAFTPPVAEYAAGSGPLQGDSVTGGYVYAGPVEALQDEYVFADFVSGNIWSVPVASLVDGQTVPASQFTIRTSEFAPDAGSLSSISSFGLDAAGNLYIVAIGGDVFQLEAAN